MSTGLNDLVLIHVDDKPGFYARVEDVAPDVKPGWWQVKFLVLTLPLQVYTWILEECQMNGTPFTMGGTPVKVEKVESPVARLRPVPPPEPSTEGVHGGKVVSIFDRKKE